MVHDVYLVTLITLTSSIPCSLPHHILSHRTYAFRFNTPFLCLSSFPSLLFAFRDICYKIYT